MSKVSTVYDGILTKLGTIFPTLTRFPNPYDILDNPYQFMTAGYSLRYDGQNRLPYEICNRRESQNFTVILTRELLRIETRSDSFDAPTKAILEDAKTFRDAFYARDMIGLADVIKLDVTSISALESVSGDKYNLLKMECAFVIDYFEPVT